VKGLVLLAAGLVAVAGARAQPGPTPLGVLRGALEAPLRTDYEAIQVLTAPGPNGPETVRAAVWHRRPHTHRTEFLAPPRLAGRLVVDDGTYTWQYEPSLHLLVQAPSLGRSDLTLLGQVLDSHTVRLLGTDVVAGRQAYLLSLLPHGPGPTRRMWVDRVTGVVLKSEAADVERGVYFTSTFTRVSFLPVPQELFRVPRPRGVRVLKLTGETVRVRTLSELSRQVGFPVVAPRELPPGFRFRSARAAAWGATRAAVLEFSDGFSGLSLFQMPAQRVGDPPGGEVMRIGGAVARAHAVGTLRLLVWERGGLRLAVVGEAPLALLREVALSVDPDPSAEARRVQEVARWAGAPADRVAELRDRGLSFSEIRAVLRSKATGEASLRTVSASSLVEELERFQRAVRSWASSRESP